MKRGKMGSRTPAIIWTATAASMMPGTEDPLGAAARMPRNRMTTPNERWRKVDNSQPRGKRSGGACLRRSANTRELGVRSLVAGRPVPYVLLNILDRTFLPGEPEQRRRQILIWTDPSL